MATRTWEQEREYGDRVEHLTELATVEGADVRALLIQRLLLSRPELTAVEAAVVVAYDVPEDDIPPIRRNLRGAHPVLHPRGTGTADRLIVARRLAPHYATLAATLERTVADLAAVGLSLSDLVWFERDAGYAIKPNGDGTARPIELAELISE